MSWARFGIILAAVILLAGAAVFYAGPLKAGKGSPGDGYYRLSTVNTSMPGFPETAAVLKDAADLARVDIDRIRDVLLGNSTIPLPETALNFPPAEVPAPEPTLSPEALAMESDADRLRRIIKSWAYSSFRNIGGQMTGKFVDESDSAEFEASEGSEHKGVQIRKLTEKYAVVGVGSASESLTLSPFAEMFLNPAEIINNPAIFNNQEYQNYAMARYMRLYGNEARERAKRYTPKPGERMPPMEPPSPEETEAAIKDYMDKYAKHFQEMSKNYTPKPGEVMPTPMDFVETQKRIKEYYDKYVRPQLTPSPAP